MKQILIVFALSLFFGIINAQSDSSPLHFSEVIKINDSEIPVFIKKTRQKVDEFQEYVIIIADKSEIRERRNLAEREALKLFYSGALIKISLLEAEGGEEIVERLIKDYLYQLKILPYKKVIIEFFDIAYLTSYEMGRDGKYYGTATIFQRITGFNGDDIEYSKTLQKDIEVILENIEDEYYGERKWKIFLGDIEASEIESNNND